MGKSTLTQKMRYVILSCLQMKLTHLLLCQNELIHFDINPFLGNINS